MEWIISLAAVAVSLVTIIVSYLTNRENLRSSSENIVSEHELAFRIEVWKEVIDLADALSQETGRATYERLLDISVGVKNSEGDEERLNNALNEISALDRRIRSLVFGLRSKIGVLDEHNDVTTEKIRAYGGEACGMCRALRSFCLDADAGADEFDALKTRAKALVSANEDFTENMRRYISRPEESVFAKRDRTHGRGGKNTHDKR